MSQKPRNGAPQVKIRLHGTPDEVDTAAERLARVFTVVAASRPYPDRGTSRLVRCYIDIRL